MASFMDSVFVGVVCGLLSAVTWAAITQVQLWKKQRQYDEAEAEIEAIYKVAMASDLESVRRIGDRIPVKLHTKTFMIVRGQAESLIDFRIGVESVRRELDKGPWISDVERHSNDSTPVWGVVGVAVSRWNGARSEFLEAKKELDDIRGLAERHVEKLMTEPAKFSANVPGKDVVKFILEAYGRKVESQQATIEEKVALIAGLRGTAETHAATVHGLEEQSGRLQQRVREAEQQIRSQADEIAKLKGGVVDAPDGLELIWVGAKGTDTATGYWTVPYQPVNGEMMPDHGEMFMRDGADKPWRVAGLSGTWSKAEMYADCDFRILFAPAAAFPLPNRWGIVEMLMERIEELDAAVTLAERLGHHSNSHAEDIEIEQKLAKVREWKMPAAVAGVLASGGRTALEQTRQQVQSLHDAAGRQQEYVSGVERELDKCRAEAITKEEALSAEIDRISGIRRNLIAAMEGTREQLQWLAGQLRVDHLKIDEPTADAAKRICVAASMIAKDLASMQSFGEEFRTALRAAWEKYMDGALEPPAGIRWVDMMSQIFEKLAKGRAPVPETVSVRFERREIPCLRWNPGLGAEIPPVFYHRPSESSGWIMQDKPTWRVVTPEWLSIFGEGEKAVPVSDEVALQGGSVLKSAGETMLVSFGGGLILCSKWIPKKGDVIPPVYYFRPKTALGKWSFCSPGGNSVVAQDDDYEYAVPVPKGACVVEAEFPEPPPPAAPGESGVVETVYAGPAPQYDKALQDLADASRETPEQAIQRTLDWLKSVPVNPTLSKAFDEYLSLRDRAERDRLHRRVEGQLREIHRKEERIGRLKSALEAAKSREASEVAKFKAEANHWRMKVEKTRDTFIERQQKALERISVSVEHYKGRGDRTASLESAAECRGMCQAFEESARIIREEIRAGEPSGGSVDPTKAEKSQMDAEAAASIAKEKTELKGKLVATQRELLADRPKIVSRETIDSGTEEKPSPPKVHVERMDVYEVGTGSCLGTMQLVRLEPREWRKNPHVCWMPGQAHLYLFKSDRGPVPPAKENGARFYRIATEEDLLT